LKKVIISITEKKTDTSDVKETKFSDKILIVKLFTNNDMTDTDNGLVFQDNLGKPVREG